MLVTSTNSLDALHDGGQRKILDLVDDLRRIGLSNSLSLPQIVVCGDQSAGKSSVLEAISEIPFPRRANFCTRFATEIVLRRSQETSISVQIVPDKTQREEAQERLRGFSRTFSDFKELPKIIDEATEAMGMSAEVGSGGKGIARDVLSIEMCGPSRPQLTLVDLPGLVHTKSKYQSDDDIDMIHKLVMDYISNKRTIILAIVSAKNDYAGQKILKYCRDEDPLGRRTLGIITKPDELKPGSEMEKSFFELARNEDIKFELGWHMLKNRDESDASDFQARNIKERAWFSQGNYRSLDPKMLGIENLRSRLSTLLQSHLGKELPSLKKELDDMLAETDQELQKLGTKRTSAEEQREYLIDISTKAHDIFNYAVRGIYEHDFFGAVETSEPVTSQSNVRRLRAAIQSLNLDFARRMHLHGRKIMYDPSPSHRPKTSKGDSVNQDEYSVPEDEEPECTSDHDGLDLTEPPSSASSPNTVGKAKTLSRDEAVDWVLRILQRTRGCELPGNFNPSLISQIFWEQSEPWKDLAIDHINTVAVICRQFVDQVLEHVAAPEAYTRLTDIRVKPALKVALDESRAELNKILADKGGHPITYNHYYTTTIQKMRQARSCKSAVGMAQSAQAEFQVYQGKIGYQTQTLIDPQKFAALGEQSIEQDMDRFSAAEALDHQSAYYKDELKYFINAITKQVVERHLVASIPNRIISPLVVHKLTESDVSYVAAEPAETTAQRDFLDRRKAMLEESQLAFRMAMTGLR